MPKITMMSGLPASGKTTKAKEILLKEGNTVRVNRDLLRTMLHFNKWTGRNESITREAQREVVRSMVGLGLNVIIDDTNLGEGNKQSWKDFAGVLGCKFVVVKMDTPLSECLDRDGIRTNAVGSHVILSMARLNGYEDAFSEREIICDIDGTVADISHRLHFLQGETKDWKGFFGAMSHDKPRTDIISLVDTTAKSLEAKVVFVSGRSDEYREQTETWLATNLPKNFPADLVLMRRAGDHRPDIEVKQEILNKFFRKKNIIAVLDDRPSVIRMWRDNGLIVNDVGNGEEF